MVLPPLYETVAPLIALPVAASVTVPVIVPGLVLKAKFWVALAPGRTPTV